jgi:Protein of unknown function (DUF1236)
MKHTLLIIASVVALATGIGSAGAQSAPPAAGPDGAAPGDANSFTALPMLPQAYVPLSAEQYASLRETLKGVEVERLSAVTFRVAIGDLVPDSVHFHRLPIRIVKYAPQYRDFDFIMVDDDILIVDPYSHRIAAVISA